MPCNTEKALRVDANLKSKFDIVLRLRIALIAEVKDTRGSQSGQELPKNFRLVFRRSVWWLR